MEGSAVWAPLGGAGHVPHVEGLCAGKLCLSDTFPHRCPEQGPPWASQRLGRKQAGPCCGGNSGDPIDRALAVGRTPEPFQLNEAIVRSLLSQSPLSVQSGRERTHCDELEAVVSRGALDAQEGGLDAGLLEGLAHVTALLLLRV